MEPRKLEPFTTTSENVPEHTQFVHMMYDIQAQDQRRKEIQGVSQDEEDLSSGVANLSMAATNEGSIVATPSTCLSLSAVQNTFYELGAEINTVRSSASFERKTANVNDTSVVTPNSSRIINQLCSPDQTITPPVYTNAAATIQGVENQPARSLPRSTHIFIGAKEMWQAGMDEDREEQETVLFQIEDTLEDDRPW